MELSRIFESMMSGNGYGNLGMLGTSDAIPLGGVGFAPTNKPFDPFGNQQPKTDPRAFALATILSGMSKGAGQTIGSKIGIPNGANPANPGFLGGSIGGDIGSVLSQIMQANQPQGGYDMSGAGQSSFMGGYDPGANTYMGQGAQTVSKPTKENTDNALKPTVQEIINSTYGNNTTDTKRKIAQAILDTSRSEAIRKQADQYITQANALPHAQVTSQPNIWSMLLAAAPAMLTGNSKYLGPLLQGYQQGQQTELARKEALRNQQVQMLLGQAKSIESDANRVHGDELAQFNQDSQNARNENNNNRIMDMAELTRKHQEEMKQYGAEEADIRFIQRTADKHFAEDPNGWTPEAQKELTDQIKAHAIKYGRTPEDVAMRIMGHTVGDLGIQAQRVRDLQNDKAYKKGVDVWKSFLTNADRQREITAQDIRDLENERQWIHSEHKVPLEAMPMPKEGMGWKQYLQGQSLNLQQGNFDAQRMKDANAIAENDFKNNVLPQHNAEVKNLEGAYNTAKSEVAKADARVAEARKYVTTMKPQKGEKPADYQARQDKAVEGLKATTDYAKAKRDAMNKIKKDLDEKRAKPPTVKLPYSQSSIGRLSGTLPPAEPFGGDTTVTNQDNTKFNVPSNKYAPGAKPPPSKPKAPSTVRTGRTFTYSLGK